MLQRINIHYKLVFIIESSKIASINLYTRSNYKIINKMIIDSIVENSSRVFIQTF